MSRFHSLVAVSSAPALMRRFRTNTAALAATVAMAMVATAANATTFLETGAIVDFVVPTTGHYAVTAWGAAGGSVIYGPPFAGGIGAELGGDFTLVAGHTLEILVGEQGRSGYYTGGGGGTFVYDKTASTLIIAAGGGGGGTFQACDTTGHGAAGGNALAGTSGGAGTTTDASDGFGGAGGTGGGGGAAGFSRACGGGSGGGGFAGNGESQAGYSAQTGGLSFLNGGAGDNFGGGGAGNAGGSGGGGGYSGGGGGGTDGIGGGGGSYVDTALLVAGTALPFVNAYAPADPEPNPARPNSANSGEVIISQAAAAPEPAAWALMLVGVGGVGGVLRRRGALAPIRGAQA